MDMIPTRKKGSSFLSTLPNVIESMFFKSWWVILFFLICYIIYDQAHYRWKQEYYKLEETLHVLKVERVKAIKEQKMLIAQINSQSDHAWIELTLMKGLGVIPKGQKKVYFSPKGQIKKY